MRIPPIISILLFPVLLTACSLDIEIEDRAADPNAIIDVLSARRALATAYTNYTSWQTMIPFSAMADDVMPTPTLPKNIEYYNYYRWQRPQLIELAGNLWESNYKTIMYINVLLERILAIKLTTDADRRNLLAIENEGKALKALCLFNLMKAFSPRYVAADAEKLPGVVNKTHVKLESPSRMSLAATADSIRRLLTPYLESKEQVTSSVYWISPLAARCLAADLELWTGNYEQVITLCKPAIHEMNNSVFGEDVYQNLWTQNNADCKECLFNIDYTPFAGLNFFDSWNHEEGDFLVVNTEIHYESTDIRRQFSLIPFKFPVDFGVSYRDVFLLGKYNAIRREKRSFRYISNYRMSDFVFLGAEAYARTGEKEKAIELMNRYLEKRGTTLIGQAVSTEKLIEHILSEKQKEFLGEGRRFFELKRLGNRTLKRYFLFDNTKGGDTIEPSDFRWTLPIPPSEYRYNPNIIQNKDWEQYLPKSQF